MKKINLDYLLTLLAIIGTCVSLPVLAADLLRPSFIPPVKSTAVSYRLIVKLKPARSTSGLSSAQIAAELSRPFSTETLQQLKAAAGAEIAELHTISNGAHILSLPSSSDKATLTRAINNMSALSNVEYVEEDRILNAQVVPSDAQYGRLWAMQPLSTVASPAPGATGNYGADFETAWNTSTGTGVVVAVVDTGITSHLDLTGNLVSSGYNFISDCRMRGSCPASTSNAAAVISPSADATDTGDFISTTDIALNPALFPGPAKSSSWHGTHVSGTIAGIRDTVGILGGAYAARILPVRVLGKGGGYTSDIADGVKWAAGVHATISNPNPARVINLSLGGIGACSITEQDAINAIVAAGAVIVVAAGNDGADVADASPANCNNVISVSATARDGSRASYSNFSSPSSNFINPVQVTLAAQGGDTVLLGFDPGIYSSINTGTTTQASSSYTYKEGTSMAAPHVSAAAALMLAYNSTLTPALVKSILTTTATTFPSFSAGSWAAYDCATLKNCGAGILNANLAVLRSIKPFTSTADVMDFGTLLFNTPVSKSVSFTNSTGAAITLGTASLTGVNATSYSITSNTCIGSIATSGTCQISVTFLPKAANTNSAGILISAIPSTSGAIVLGLTGVASPPVSAATAIAATRSAASSSAGGGCSIMGISNTPDSSLLLIVLTLLAYRIYQRQRITLGKN